MKTLKALKSTLLTLAAVAALASCGKNDDGKSTPPYEGVEIGGLRWSEYNLGAPGKFTDQPHAFGMFYQWGRKIGWSSTNPAVNSNGGTAWSDTPIPSEWLVANDPCPKGWRVPTWNEYESLLDQSAVAREWVTTPVNGYVFTDKLSGASIFFPAAGNRNSREDGMMAGNGDGRLDNTGLRGYYWSWTPTELDSHSTALYMNDRTAGRYYADRSHGYSVRCVGA